MTSETAPAINAFTTRIAPVAFKHYEQTRVVRAIEQQPPQHGIGQHAAPAVDTVALDAVRALQRCDTDRGAHYRSKGVRAITT